MDMFILFKIVITNIIVLVCTISIFSLENDNKSIFNLPKKLEIVMAAWIVLTILSAPTYGIIALWRL